MTRTMYDAVTVANVPASATLIAGYGDGYYQNVAGFRARFPHATVVEIAVFAHDNLGVVLDVETGDASPSQAPGWVQMRRAAGVDPTVYCNSSTWPAVQAAFHSAGVREPHYWIARYDGNPAIPAGAIAKQYSDPGPYDLSSVADYWPGVDPAPAPTPTPAPVPPEDIVTPQDIQDIATAVQAAVWNYQVPDWGLNAQGQPVPLGTSKAIYWHVLWNDVNQALIEGLFKQVMADVAAAKLTPADVQQALADGTLKVQITVAPAASAA